MSEVLWRPKAEAVADSAMATFRAQFSQTLGRELPDWQAFWQASIDEPETFWAEIWRAAGIRAAGDSTTVLIQPGDMQSAKWFPDVRLNYAENLLRRDDDGPAIIAHGEDGRRRVLSWRELRLEVATLQQRFELAGVGEGDRVAAIMPNTADTVVAMLATAAGGATWSSCSPDFGVQGILDRFGQIEPKVLVAVDGYHYAGKAIDIRPKLKDVVAQLPSLELIVLVRYLDPAADLAAAPDVVCFDVLPRQKDAQPNFTRVPFSAPLYILYSSGTTGVPKAIVHGVGGTLLQHWKELALHCNLGPNERIFYFTTCGWMMWNWLMSALAVEATLVLYDGSPFHPGPGRLMELAATEDVVVFGTSAKYIDALKKSGYAPAQQVDLTSLRALLSTGSPLLPESFDFVYSAIKQDLLLGSISGGTDIVSCFVLANPTLPVRRGEIQCRGLGMAVDVWDDGGRPVRGEKGELVCTRAFPSMPVMFWNDPDGDRYRRAYFDRFRGVWCHGDFAEITDNDGVVIHGRSDAVLNPGGVRIGTAEVYRQVEQIEAVLEALCVGQEWEGDVRVVLFVRLRDGVELDDALTALIKQRIKENASPRHVPARIVQVSDIPRTLSGKIVELAVRDVIHGRPVKNTSALANPEALEQFRDRTELAG